MANELGITGYDYVEFYVGTSKMWAYWHAKGMGLKITAYSGLETGVKETMDENYSQSWLENGND